MKISEAVLLAPFTTIRIGGPARYLVRIRSLNDLREALRFAKGENLPFFIMGEGSNILVADEGFPGVVIKMEMRGIEWGRERGGRVEVSSGAGEHWDSLVEGAVRKGLTGIENLSGIPGTVGAASIQNIGAYAVELKEVVSWVEVYDAKRLRVRRLIPTDCRFSYRSSLFKMRGGEHFIVTRMNLRLRRGGRLKLSYRDLVEYFGGKDQIRISPADVRQAVIEIRRRKFPDLSRCGTAGSFFKNPIITDNQYNALSVKFPGLPNFPLGRGKVKISAGWILERLCALKGARRKHVGTFENHALVVVNFGGGTARDIEALAAEMVQSARDRTGIELEWEVVKVPFQDRK